MPYLGSILELFKPLPVGRDHGTEGALALVAAPPLPGGVFGAVGPDGDFRKRIEKGLFNVHIFRHRYTSISLFITNFLPH